MKYIILEIIPTKFENGDIIQLSALKLKDLNLVDRFDYRLNEDKIMIPDLLKIISYDKDKFIYENSTKEILSKFSDWVEDYNLLIINNKYTYNYLKEIKKEVEYIEDKLNLEYTDDLIERIKEKYKLQDSNYIVDLLYEALIYESNNK